MNSKKRSLKSALAGMQKSSVVWKPDPKILLCPQIPKPMHGVAPRVVLGEKWWRETRRATTQATDNHCLACGVHIYSAEWHQWLEGHEMYDIDYLKGRMTYIKTVPLCCSCHSFIHVGRLESLLEQGKITHRRYAAIMQHGQRVLDSAGLRKNPAYNGPVAKWENWRLIVNGQEYPPLYRNFEEWRLEHKGHA